MGFFLSSIGLRLSAIGIATLAGLSVWGCLRQQGYEAALSRVQDQERKANARARAARDRARSNPGRVLDRYRRD